MTTNQNPADKAREHLRGMALSLATGTGPLVEPKAFDRALDAYRDAVLREAADIAESLRQFEKTTGPRWSAQVSENVGILRVADELRRRADEGEAAEAYDRALRTPPSAAACAALRERMESGQVARRRVQRRLADETQPAGHVCKPGTSTYYCPTSGETESDCHGGHDVCCDRPDLHQPAAEAHPAEHTWAAELYDPLAKEWVPGSRYAVRNRAVNALEHGKRIGPTWKDGTPTQRRLVRATTTYTVEQPAAERQDGAQP